MIKASSDPECVVAEHSTGRTPSCGSQFGFGFPLADAVNLVIIIQKTSSGTISSSAQRWHVECLACCEVYNLSAVHGSRRTIAPRCDHHLGSYCKISTN